MGSANPLMQHIATRNMSSDLSKNAKPETSGVRGMLPANSVSLGNGGDLQWLYVLSSPILFKPATSVVERARQPLREEQTCTRAKSHTEGAHLETLSYPLKEFCMCSARWAERSGLKL